MDELVSKIAQPSSESKGFDLGKFSCSEKTIEILQKYRNYKTAIDKIHQLIEKQTGLFGENSQYLIPLYYKAGLLHEFQGEQD